MRAGMRIGEALSRCPALALVAPDPVRAEAAWERSLRALESIGAEVEPSRAGEAFFPSSRCAGSAARPERCSRGRGGRWTAAPRVGAAPNRLTRAGGGDADARPPAGAGALRRRRRRLLAGLPVGELRGRLARPGARPAAPGREAEEATCIDSLERLGVRTLGELAALPAAAVADRFGELGLRALRLARGDDEPLRPRRRPRRARDRASGCRRRPRDSSSSTPSSCWWSGCSRIPAQAQPHDPQAADRGPARRRRRLALRGRRCAAPAPAPSGCMAALAPRLGELPGPAAWLGLRALDLGPEAGEQGTLARSPADERRERLSRGGAAGALGGGPRRGAAGARGRPRLAGARAPGDPGAVRIRAGCPLAEAAPAGLLAAADRGGGGRRRRAARDRRGRGSSRCASDGWSRTAGGRPRPLRREYFEVVLADGRDLVVFREPPDGKRWYEQRG